MKIMKPKLEAFMILKRGKFNQFNLHRLSEDKERKFILFAFFVSQHLLLLLLTRSISRLM